MSKTKSKKKFSSQDKYKYYSKRCAYYYNATDEVGMRKYFFASGYLDAFDRVFDGHHIKRDFGWKASNSYRLGHMRGKRSFNSMKNNK